MTTALTLASHGHDWFPFFPLVPLLFFGLLVTLFFVFGRRRARTWPARSGEAVLAERYARGEIDEAELRARRAVLRSKN